MNLTDFLVESNRIERIMRPPSGAEISATESFLQLKAVTVQDMERLVYAYQPDARLRRVFGMDVRVGKHKPPGGGPHIEKALVELLRNEDCNTPYIQHLHYEMLHPFMDGNGRSGRALWLWRMGGSVPLGFLHTFYYQSLELFEELLLSQYSVLDFDLP